MYNNNLCIKKGVILILKRNNIWTIFLLCISLSACGYRFAGSGSFPAGIKSVCIPILKNHTSEAGIENTITNDLIYEVTRHDITVLSSKDKADGILSGVIRSMTIEAITHKDPQTSSERRVTVTVNLKLTSRSGKVVWSTKGLSDYEEYDVMQNKLETEQNRRDAISTLSKRLAERVYNRLTDDF